VNAGGPVTGDGDAEVLAPLLVKVLAPMIVEILSLVVAKVLALTMVCTGTK